MFFIDSAYNSLIKYGEELCGDHVEQVDLEDSRIFVLSDGLGSGVKANILATLTSKIAATMLREGSSLEETIDTIVHTLPICSERKLAYSTFTIIKVFKDGRAYCAEFDNPSVILVKNGESFKLDKVQRVINDKVILESVFDLDEDTMLVAISDGVVHAGVGKSLSLGWEWENVEAFLKELSTKSRSTKSAIRLILDRADSLYEGRAGDDTTVLAVKIRRQEAINLFTGPPKNPDEDYEVIKKILEAEGKVVVCGGTTASIVAKTIGCEIEVDVSTMTPGIPPIGIIPRIALVTEGVITINRAVEIIRLYIDEHTNHVALSKLNENNAASMLAKILIEECDKLNIWFGQAVNPAHQTPDFNMNFDFKMNQINDLAELLRSLGKEVSIKYI